MYPRMSSRQEFVDVESIYSEEGQEKGVEEDTWRGWEASLVRGYNEGFPEEIDEDAFWLEEEPAEQIV